MSMAAAALVPPPVELPTTKCAKCGGVARLAAFDRSGAPIYVCIQPLCKAMTQRARPA
jgi:hypothetical protein